MIPFATPASVLRFGRIWWKLLLGVVIGAGLVLPVGQCQGRDQARMKFRVQIAEADARGRAANAVLLEKTAAERIADIAKITATSKGRSDAIHAGPDARPSGPECRLNRRRLLDAGHRDADLAQCE